MGTRNRLTYRTSVPSAVLCSGCGQTGLDVWSRTLGRELVPYEVIRTVTVCPACDLIEKVNSDA